MKYIYSTSQMSKLSLILHTFSITGLVAGLFLTLCTCTVRDITNHAIIGKYHLRFFPKEFFTCLCGDHPIKTRNHILYNYRGYGKYWNSKRDSLKDIILFLEFNPGVFSFYEGIT